MADIEIVIKLPQELVERAKAVGVQIEAQSEQIAAVIEAQIRRREAAQQLRQVAEQLHSLPDELKPTADEIDAEIRAYRAEKAAKDNGESHS
jgi:hypothetical protein